MTHRSSTPAERHRSTRRGRSTPRALAVLFTTLLVAGLGAVIGAGPAGATVGTVPAANTPYLASPNSVITALASCGTKIYAVGNFTSVEQGGVVYPRGYGFDFDSATGKLLAFDPRANGPLYAVAMTSDCRFAYVGGSFSSINGVSELNLAAVGSVFGYTDTDFNPNPNRSVDALAVVTNGSRLIVGGAFTHIGTVNVDGLASLLAARGTNLNYLQVPLSGKLPASGGLTRVNHLEVSPNGTQMLVHGNFTTVNGVPRRQIFEMDLGATAATMDPWSNSKINTTSCAPDIAYYMRDAAYSPDGTTIYIAASGRNGSSPYCDAVSAFANTPAAPQLWINKTGQDSLYSVAASATDVYVGGHERWANNPYGANNCGVGCVDRVGVGSISPSTGLATAWNPGRSRGHGADAMLIRPEGLYVASDNNLDSTTCAGQYHPGLCLFPGKA